MQALNFTDNSSFPSVPSSGSYSAEFSTYVQLCPVLYYHILQYETAKYADIKPKIYWIYFKFMKSFKK